MESPRFHEPYPIFVVALPKNHHNCRLEDTSFLRLYAIGMKILLASEQITNRPCEGTLVFLMHLCRFLQRNGELTVLHAVGEIDADIRSLRILSRKTLVTERLIRLTRAERFDIALYVPLSGLTAFGLARGALLRLIAKSPTIVIGLQERNVGGMNRFLSLFGNPDLVLSPVKTVQEGLEEIGINTGFIMAGYDAMHFKPVNSEIRSRLKDKYGLPRDRFILLHVGHVKENRNLEVLLRYRDWGSDVQPVVKAGEVDPSWTRRLRLAGIIVIEEYLHDVHELYQASDAYLFPVNSPVAAVEYPLSVIEACACNLPVITTRFGGLPGTIREGNGFCYYDRISEIAERIASVRESHPDTASKVRDFSWDMVFRRHLYPQMRSLAAESKGENVK
jgi:glycosyltransferase involved in cell wall biosynthesis